MEISVEGFGESRCTKLFDGNTQSAVYKLRVTIVVKRAETGLGRAGTTGLSILSSPLTIGLLSALRSQPRSVTELRNQVGSPSPTTLRGYLNDLEEAGIVSRRKQDAFPGTVMCELTASGRQLLIVGDVLQAWLNAYADGPVALGTPLAKRLVKSLVDGWSASIIRAIAARPLCLIDLNGLISSLNYPSLERRLRAMRMAHLVEPVESEGQSTHYAPTLWLRAAIAPLSAAARWERRFMPTTSTPIGRLDIEAAFLLVVPMLTLPEELSGRCRFAVETRNGNGGGMTGVLVEVEAGQVVSCVSQLRGEATGWACGSAGAWLRTVIDWEPAELEIGGDTRLAKACLESLHQSLFRVRSLTP
ncbi:MAG: helix-turn-helix transcriptional regulator [Actinobacteria bacterium]|nr:MAG: helix-turn-helix transcriptional regulator [Actinomycetota bacterium]